MSQLQVAESPREQASDETIAWQFDWTNRLGGQTISSALGVVTQLDTDTDVSATCLLGAPVINSAQVQLVVKSLVARKRYRVTVRATLSGGTVQDADLLLQVPH